jgi:hypothetical protein
VSGERVVGLVKAGVVRGKTGRKRFSRPAKRNDPGDRHDGLAPTRDIGRHHRMRAMEVGHENDKPPTGWSSQRLFAQIFAGAARKRRFIAADQVERLKAFSPPAPGSFSPCAKIIYRCARCVFPK